MEQYALGLGYAHVDVPSAWQWLQRELARQDHQGNIPQIIQTQAATPPFYSILVWNWWKKVPEALDLSLCFAALYQQQRYWYEQRDPQGLGLPSIHWPEEAPLPELYTALYPQGNFVVQDPAFLALLCRANECLIDLGQSIGTDITELVQWQELSVFGLNEDLWHVPSKRYRALDVSTGEYLADASWLSQYLPLYAGVPDQEQAEHLCRSLITTHFLPDFWLLPIQAVGKEHSTTTVSLLLNRLLYVGLLRYGFKENAALLKRKTLQMVGDYGFYPRYQAAMDPYTNIGLGAGNEPSAAALILDLATGIPEKRSLEQIW